MIIDARLENAVNQNNEGLGFFMKWLLFFVILNSCLGEIFDYQWETFFYSQFQVSWLIREVSYHMYAVLEKLSFISANQMPGGHLEFKVYIRCGDWVCSHSIQD